MLKFFLRFEGVPRFCNCLKNIHQGNDLTRLVLMYSKSLKLTSKLHLIFLYGTDLPTFSIFIQIECLFIHVYTILIVMRYSTLILIPYCNEVHYTYFNSLQF